MERSAYSDETQRSGLGGKGRMKKRMRNFRACAEMERSAYSDETQR